MNLIIQNATPLQARAIFDEATPVSQLVAAANALSAANNDRSRAIYARKPTLPANPSIDDLLGWLSWNDAGFSWDADWTMPELRCLMASVLSEPGA